MLEVASVKTLRSKMENANVNAALWGHRTQGCQSSL